MADFRIIKRPKFDGGFKYAVQRSYSVYCPASKPGTLRLRLRWFETWVDEGDECDDLETAREVLRRIEWRNSEPDEVVE